MEGRSKFITFNHIHIHSLDGGESALGRRECFMEEGVLEGKGSTRGSREYWREKEY